MVLVHRLVQAITLAQAAADTRRQRQAGRRSPGRGHDPEDTELPAPWPTCALLPPHTRATLELTSSGMWRIADSLGVSGNYADSP
jgi:hypothetical protein